MTEHLTGYKVGAYGPGAVCQLLLDAKPVTFPWLANAPKWQGCYTFTEWVLKHAKAQQICGLNADPELAHGPFGAWTTT